jgi:hypothetical protein
VDERQALQVLQLAAATQRRQVELVGLCGRLAEQVAADRARLEQAVAAAGQLVAAMEAMLDVLGTLLEAGGPPQTGRRDPGPA